MKSKKLIFLALILSITALLCSCAGGAGQDTGTEASATEAQSEVKISYNIVSAELCYKLIRGDDADQAAVDATIKLKKALAEKFGEMYTGGIGSDFTKGYKSSDTIDVDDYEILVGETNRRESREEFTKLKENEFVIKTVGKKLVIIGENSYATSAAVEYFINNVLNTCDASGLVFETNYLYTGVRAETRPPLAEGATLRFLSWNLGCGVGVASNVVNVLNEFEPDIIALQECNKDMHSNVITAFTNKHREYKTAKLTHSGSSTLIYTPIVYNSKKMTLVKADSEWLDSRYTGTNTKCLCWAVFDSDEGRFAVITFHGAVCSNDYKGYENYTSEQLSATASQWRLDNVRQLLDVKAKLVETYGNIPISICGDCNFNKNSQPYANLINAGFKDAEFTAAKIIKSGYKTSYSYSNGIPGEGLSIDHIFGINGVYFASFDIIRTNDVAKGSDHTPIYVDFAPCGKK